MNIKTKKLLAEKALAQETMWDFCDTNMETALTYLLQELCNPKYKHTYYTQYMYTQQFDY